MSHGWIKDKFLRAGVGRGPRLDLPASAAITRYALCTHSFMTNDFSEADITSQDGVNAVYMGAADISAADVAAGTAFSFAQGGMVKGIAEVNINEGEFLGLGNDGKLSPYGLMGSTFSTSTGGNGANQPSNDGVEVLSDSALDTGQALTIWGTTDSTATVVAETITTNGTSVVSTTKVDWGEILGASITGGIAAVGTITLRDASGDATIITITAGNKEAAGTVKIAQGDTQRGLGTSMEFVADAATTKIIGLVGTDRDGTAQLAALALSGTTTVFNSDEWLTVTHVLAVDVESARTWTVSHTAIAGRRDDILGIATEDIAADASGNWYFSHPREMVTTINVNDMGDTIFQTKSTTIETADVLTLNSVPVDILSAPGPGKAYVVIGVQAYYKYDTAAFSGIAAGEDLVIQDEAGNQFAEIETTGLLDQTNDEWRYASGGGGSAGAFAAATLTANQALQVALLVDDITGGGASSLTVEVEYRVITLLS